MPVQSRLVPSQLVKVHVHVQPCEELFFVCSVNHKVRSRTYQTQPARCYQTQLRSDVFIVAIGSHGTFYLRTEKDSGSESPEKASQIGIRYPRKEPAIFWLPLGCRHAAQ